MYTYICLYICMYIYIQTYTCIYTYHVHVYAYDICICYTGIYVYNNHCKEAYVCPKSGPTTLNIVQTEVLVCSLRATGCEAQRPCLGARFLFGGESLHQRALLPSRSLCCSPSPCLHAYEYTYTCVYIYIMFICMLLYTDIHMSLSLSPSVTVCLSVSVSHRLSFYFTLSCIVHVAQRRS